MVCSLFLMTFLMLVKAFGAENQVPSGVWEQCLRGNMPEAVVSAIYGSCAGSKCADLTAGNFWEHCVKADEIFVQAVEKLYGKSRGKQCRTIVKVMEDTLVDDSICNPNPCQNEGYCSPDIADGSEDFRCTCRPAFSGKTCESPVEVCDPNPCLNDGYCEASQDEPAEATCNCRMGFSGKNCEHVIQVCSPNPCLNGGYCQANGTGSHVCSCYPGFGGMNCETKIGACSANPCENSGFCLENGPTEYSCICLNGFGGKNCEIPVSPCQSNPCQNGGKCVEKSDEENGFICNCLSDYGGRHCDVGVVWPVNCSRLADGDYADPSVCPSETFYRCEDGVGRRLQCAGKKFFSEKRRDCTFRWNVRC